jgi:hypothetical protein
LPSLPTTPYFRYSPRNVASYTCAAPGGFQHSNAMEGRPGRSSRRTCFCTSSRLGAPRRCCGVTPDTHVLKSVTVSFWETKVSSSTLPAAFTCSTERKNTRKHVSSNSDAPRGTVKFNRLRPAGPAVSFHTRWIVCPATFLPKGAPLCHRCSQINVHRPPAFPRLSSRAVISNSTGPASNTFLGHLGPTPCPTARHSVAPAPPLNF